MLTILNIVAGVSLLVWGTHIVRTGILRLYGGDLRRVLRRSVASRWRAFLAGLGVTALIQSSNATALMIAAFAGQGLIANVGSRGRVWIDREQYRVLRFEQLATEIPPDFPITAASTTSPCMRADFATRG